MTSLPAALTAACRRLRLPVATVVLALFCTTCTPRDHRFEWQSAPPESHGMSSPALDALKDRLAASATRALLIVRDDRIVYEWYARDHGPRKRHGSASVAKAAVGGVALGIALTDGRMSLDDRVADYIPQWKHDPRKSRITLRHLGSHSSGLDDAEADGLSHGELTGWKGGFWKRLDPPRDPFTLSRDEPVTLFDPGERFSYSSPGIAMLTYAVTASLERSPHRDIRTLLRHRVMRPIGVRDKEWAVGYHKTYTVDGLALVPSWGGASYTARALARVGRLMLRGGDWEGTQLLSAEAVHQITSDAGMPGHGAIGWWSNNSGKYRQLPRDAFWTSGDGHQVMLVIPSLNLIAVRNGRDLGSGEDHHDALNTHIFEPLLETVMARTAPYPPSPVVSRIEWGARGTILRQANGSDNWPLTWGDDGHLYAAYGDGKGFDPSLRQKLSLGLARIEGHPPHFIGVNLPAPTLEQRGDGKSGKKASGLLMVDGVLYLWARNAGNAQLAWSHDRGHTWMWNGWRFTTGFGAPTFLNSGRHYANAPDQYVYVYSHDHDNAYAPADRMVLARVPKGEILRRDAYEFLKTISAEHEPIWTKQIEERGAVFVHPGQCYRSSVVYNAGLKRYLWSQTLPGSDGDPRFRGGFGVYDAPHPWGPWTTVFYTDSWDVGPGEMSTFPTKWMSADGTRLHLVFSGDDYFAVRKATLILSAPD